MLDRVEPGVANEAHAGTPETTSAGMLAGIRIVDMSGVIFGPYATEMLAEQGADVIKVESPQLDAMRICGKPARTRYMAPPHLTLNRGKRSILLDLKNSEDAATMRQLLATADVFIHNVRANAITKLGFSYADVKAIRDDIIYVHCVGFGEGGPYSDLQAYDDVIQAASGASSLASRVDGDPAPRYLPMAIADKVAALYGVQAVLTAMVHRLRTGRGQEVKVPMFESFMHFLLQEHLFNGTFVPEDPAEKPRLGYPRQLDPTRQPFQTADGYLCVVPYTDGNLISMLEVIGRSEVLAEPDFSTPRGRGNNMNRIYQIIRDEMPKKTSAEWMDILRSARVPVMPVCDLDDVLNDPHLQAVEFFRRREHPTEGPILEIRSPFRYSDSGRVELQPAPVVGQHTEEIKAELAGR